MANEALKQYRELMALARSYAGEQWPVLSRAHANDLIQRARRSEALMQAYFNRSHPFNKRATEIAANLDYWSKEHPTRPDGSPLPLREMPNYEDPSTDVFPEIPNLEHLTPDAARARLEWLRTQDEFVGYLSDPKHPAHATAQEGMARLRRLAAGLPSKIDVALQIKAQDRIQEIRDETALDPKHPYWEKTDPDHQAVVQEMDQLYAIVNPDGDAGDRDGQTALARTEVRSLPAPASSGTPTSSESTGRLSDMVASTRADVTTLHKRIAADPKHPYNDRRHPDYKAAQDRMNALYAATAPVGTYDPDNMGRAHAGPSLRAPTAANPIREHGPQSVTGRDQARTEIARIRKEAASDPKHPYNDRRHPDYKATQARMNELYTGAAEPGEDTNDGGQTSSAQA
ncbi:hypothetical protein [Dongia sp.]|uniref:hypothetical protein n=1 Tax=Dongia sp. TaxID=1977262 RepID=UPI003750954C